MNRRELTVRRWGYVLVLSMMGALIALVAFAVCVSMLQVFLRTSLWVVGAGCAATLCFVFQGAWIARPGRRTEDETQGAYSQYVQSLTDRFCAYFGLKHFLSYPPVWVAGYFGAALLIGVISFSSSLRLVLNLNADLSSGLLWMALGYGASPLLVGIVAGVWALLSKSPRSRSSEALAASDAKQFADQHQPFASWDQLRAWLLQDAPVVRLRDDAFGHAVAARRIAKRLQEDPIPPQVVVGALGAGKTTLRHLVEAELGSTTATHILSIELWPYETPQAAVGGVLRTLLQGVARETNVLSARGLPENYIAAMSAVGGVASKLASLAERPRSPFDVLDAIDRIAMTIGHRFVVWVEDLERFAHASGGESLEHSERLAPLRALLFGLSQLKAVSVVTSTVELHARFDTEKIARYVEELPALEYANTARILQAFRSGCLKRPFINPAAPGARNEWESFDAAERAEFRALYGEAIDSLPDTAVFLCRTPRRLKQALRRVHSVWDAMTGEIDFDDLLVMHLLREAEPAAFAVVQVYRDDLTSSLMSQSARNDARDAFGSALNALALGGNRTKAVNLIVNGVLLDGNGRLKPQGLHIRRYWKRFLAEPDIPPEELDQPVLETLDRGDDDAILTLLEGTQSAQVESFSRRISAERLLTLFVALARRRVPENPSGWFNAGEGSSGDPPGMIPLWRILLRSLDSGASSVTDVSEALAGAFDLAISNLHLVCKLDEYFVGANESDCMLNRHGAGEQQLAESARQRLWALLFRTYVDEPTALIRALRGAPEWTLEHVVWGSARIHRKEFTSLPFADWSRLAPTILDTCDQAPELMLPQLAALVVKETGLLLRNENGARMKQEFDRTKARLLFGDEQVVLRRYRGRVPVIEGARYLMEAMMDAARAIGDDDEQGGDG